jgi:Putative mono-oxygenase ydhR
MPKEEGTMITAIVEFKLPQPITREKAMEIFLSTAPRYRETNGLIRKYYILSEDGGTAGGVYLWKSRKEAESVYTKDWENFVRGKYGAPPSVKYFESPVVVDNVTQEIISER